MTINRLAWIVSSLFFCGFSTHSLAASKDLAACILRQIRIASPDSTAVDFPVKNPKRINRLNAAEKKLLLPEFDAVQSEAGAISFRLSHTEEFLNQTLPPLGKKGLFTIFIPSGADARVKVGHLMVLVGDAIFDRNLDSPEPMAIRSVSLSELPALFRNFPYAVTQYFELSEKSIESLNRYFHDRTWFYHEGNPNYKTRYVGLPFTKDSKILNGENCDTFAYSFLTDLWQKARPELKSVQREMGGLRVNQVPNRQLFNNTQAASYRGTIIVSQDLEKFKAGLLKDGLRNDENGAQLLLEGRIQFHLKK